MRAKIAVLLILMLVLGYATQVDADFQILLKNGRKLMTGKYWYNKNEIRFYYLGGVVGIEKKAVARIIPVKTHYRELDTEESGAAAPPGEAKAAAPGKAEVMPQKVKAAAPAALTSDERYLHKFQSISSRAKDIPSMTTGELYGFSREISTFKKEVMNKGIGHLYTDQLIDLYSVGDQIEQALKARAQ